jgi:hypothetical protein
VYPPDGPISLTVYHQIDICTDIGDRIFAHMVAFLMHRLPSRKILSFASVLRTASSLASRVIGLLISLLMNAFLLPMVSVPDP